ncbi:MAG: hypothetical protein LCH53_06000 [Bacteroidetes bacterium]|nr:hypothetical protein [Bacteroidota bacterium]
MNTPHPTPGDIRAEVLGYFDEMRAELDTLFGLDRGQIDEAEDLDDLDPIHLAFDGGAQWELAHTIETFIERAAALGALYAAPDLLASPPVAFCMMGTRFREALTHVADQLDAARAARILDSSSRPEELRADG